MEYTFHANRVANAASRGSDFAAPTSIGSAPAVLIENAASSLTTCADTVHASFPQICSRQLSIAATRAFYPRFASKSKKQSNPAQQLRTAGKRVE
jgi:hypothetical protein